MMRLKEFRESKGLSQEKFAIKIGYTLSMTTKVESGRVKASRRFMEKTKEAFPEISIDEIFFADKQQNNCYT